MELMMQQQLFSFVGVCVGVYTYICMLSVWAISCCCSGVGITSRNKLIRPSDGQFAGPFAGLLRLVKLARRRLIKDTN